VGGRPREWRYKYKSLALVFSFPLYRKATVIITHSTIPGKFTPQNKEVQQVKRTPACHHLYKNTLIPDHSSSFSSAPPPAIEISTPWEIIVRVSSASDLPRPWHLLGGLSRLHLFTFSGASGLPSRGLWIPSWFRSSSFALMFLPFTPHFATRLA